MKSVLQSCLSTAWGGLEMVAFENAARLRANGFGVTTACLPDSALRLELEKAGLPVVQVERRHKYFAYSAVRAFRRELATGHSAVLVQQLADLWQVVPALTGRPDVRLVGIAHTFVGIGKKDFLHRRLYGRMNALIALTERHKKNLIDHLPVRPEQVHVLPNHLDTTRFQPSKRDPEFRSRYAGTGEILIGVVSRLDENKGLREAVAAAALLREAGASFRMAIVGKETAGESGMQKALEQEIQARELGGHVHLAGHHASIERVIASFDILLMPSPAETFGRVLIEAMASGVPIVAAGGGGVPDIIRDGVNGRLVRPGDAPAMSQALREYIQDPQARQRMCGEGLRQAKEIYDTAVVEKRLYDLLGL